MLKWDFNRTKIILARDDFLKQVSGLNLLQIPFTALCTSQVDCIHMNHCSWSDWDNINTWHMMISQASRPLLVFTSAGILLHSTHMYFCCKYKQTGRCRNVCFHSSSRTHNRRNFHTWWQFSFCRQILIYLYSLSGALTPLPCAAYISDKIRKEPWDFHSPANWTQHLNHPVLNLLLRWLRSDSWVQSSN